MLYPPQTTEGLKTDWGGLVDTRGVVEKKRKIKKQEVDDCWPCDKGNPCLDCLTLPSAELPQADAPSPPPFPSPSPQSMHFWDCLLQAILVSQEMWTFIPTTQKNCLSRFLGGLVQKVWGFLGKYMAIASSSNILHTVYLEPSTKKHICILIPPFSNIVCTLHSRQGSWHSLLSFYFKIYATQFTITNDIIVTAVLYHTSHRREPTDYDWMCWVRGALISLRQC